MSKEKTGITATQEAAAAEVEAQRKTLTPEAPKGVSEESIAEKVKAGLTRDQAIQAIQAQADHDAAQAKPKK